MTKSLSLITISSRGVQPRTAAARYRSSSVVPAPSSGFSPRIGSGNASETVRSTIPEPPAAARAPGVGAAARIVAAIANATAPRRTDPDMNVVPNISPVKYATSPRGPRVVTRPRHALHYHGRRNGSLWWQDHITCFNEYAPFKSAAIYDLAGKLITLGPGLIRRWCPVGAVDLALGPKSHCKYEESPSIHRGLWILLVHPALGA